MTFRVLGYAPRWHVTAGDAVPLHASSAHEDVWLQIRRVDAFIANDTDWVSKSHQIGGAATSLRATDVPLQLGSYFRATKPSAPLHEMTVGATSLLAQSPPVESTLVEIRGLLGAVAIQVTPENELILNVRDLDAHTSHFGTGLVIRPGTWWDVILEVTDDAVVVTRTDHRGSQSENFAVTGPTIGPIEEVIIAGKAIDGQSVVGDIDAKVDNLWASTSGGVTTHWDFSEFPYSSSLSDSAGISEKAELVNGATRAVTGSSWRGRETDFRMDPTSYGAVAFHRDDLEDASWPIATRAHIPADARPGVYCLVLSLGQVPDFTDPTSFFPVTIFVTGQPDHQADVALVLPTFSYRAYANNAFYEDAPPETYLRKGPTASEPVYNYVATAGLKSLYGQHADGTGVQLASMKRPQSTVRPDWVSQLLGQPHQLSADLEIIQWLDSLGVSWTLLTDETLHERGTGALAPFRTVITGTHPEYCSTETLNAYDDHMRAGGNLMYLGGNGFILKVEVPHDQPWMQELRRGDNGGDIWASRPGEMHHQYSGRPGGLWRRIGRPPNLLTGLGFSAMGFSGSGTYRTPLEQPLDCLPDHLRAVVARIAGRVADSAFGRLAIAVLIEPGLRNTQDPAGDLHGSVFRGDHFDRRVPAFGLVSCFNRSTARRAIASSVSSSRIRLFAVASSPLSAVLSPAASPRSIRSCRRQL